MFLFLFFTSYDFLIIEDKQNIFGKKNDHEHHISKSTNTKNKIKNNQTILIK
jgi:hypothetical protein